jgi:hypothetical protein
MSDVELQPAAEPAPGLSQWQRVSNTFSAPSKTFEDIKHGHKSWWMPFLISALVGYLMFGAITLKVGWAQVAENIVHLNPKLEERLAQMPEAQRGGALKGMQYGPEIGFAASPVIVIVVAALSSLVLLGTINFGFGGKSTFGSVFAVWMFAWLPAIFKSLLGTLVLFTGTPETFNLNNFAPTSLGAFLNPLETNAALYKLATALDVTYIWSMVLLSIGLAAVAGVKRSSGYIAVFGWWGLITVIRAFS